MPPSSHGLPPALLTRLHAAAAAIADSTSCPLCRLPLAPATRLLSCQHVVCPACTAHALARAACPIPGCALPVRPADLSPAADVTSVAAAAAHVAACAHAMRPRIPCRLRLRLRSPAPYPPVRLALRLRPPPALPLRLRRRAPRSPAAAAVAAEDTAAREAPEGIRVRADAQCAAREVPWRAGAPLASTLSSSSSPSSSPLLPPSPSISPPPSPTPTPPRRISARPASGGTMPPAPEPPCVSPAPPSPSISPPPSPTQSPPPQALPLHNKPFAGMERTTQVNGFGGGVGVERGGELSEVVQDDISATVVDGGSCVPSAEKGSVSVGKGNPGDGTPQPLAKGEATVDELAAVKSALHAAALPCPVPDTSPHADAFYVCFTSLGRDPLQQELAYELAERLGAEPLYDFRSERLPNCVVTRLHEKTRGISSRTMVIHEALARRIPIVDVSWLTACYRAGLWLPTAAFEALTAARRGGEGVFCGVVASFDDAFTRAHTGALVRRAGEDLRRIMRAGGAMVAETAEVADVAAAAAAASASADTGVRLHVHVACEFGASGGPQASAEDVEAMRSQQIGIATRVVGVGWISDCLFSGECPPGGGGTESFSGRSEISASDSDGGFGG